MSREKEFAKNSAILTIGTILPKIASLITLPIITEFLTKTEYGIYDMVTVLVALLLPVATLQIQTAAFRFLIASRDDIIGQKKIITNILIPTILICIIFCTASYFFLNSFSLITRLLMLSYCFIDILLTTARQIARGVGMNKAYAVSALIDSFIEMILIIILLFVYKKGLDGALFSLVLGQFVSLVYIIKRTRLISFIDLSQLSFSEVKRLIGYSWPMIPNSLSSWIMRGSDRLVLTGFVGIEASAIYAVANKLPNIFSIIQSTFSLAWQENASISVNDKDSSRYYEKMFDIIFSLLIGVMALLIAITPLLFKLLIHGEYNDAYNHVLILYIGVLFSLISTYLGGIYIAHMKTKEIATTTIIAAALNLVINLALVNYIGIYAASISTAISHIWLTVYRMRDVKKIFNICFDTKKIVLLIVMVLAMLILCSLQNCIVNLINLLGAFIVAFVLNKELLTKIYSKLYSHKKKHGFDA